MDYVSEFILSLWKYADSVERLITYSDDLIFWHAIIVNLLQLVISE